LTFHIGNQHANQINNVGRDQFVAGGQHGATVNLADAQAAAQALRYALRQLTVPDVVRDELERQAAAVALDLASGTPDPERLAGRLERVTTLLGRLGALATTGAALTGPLSTLGHWLGPAGAALLRLLP